MRSMKTCYRQSFLCLQYLPEYPSPETYQRSGIEDIETCMNSPLEPVMTVSEIVVRTGLIT